MCGTVHALMNSLMRYDIRLLTSRGTFLSRNLLAWLNCHLCTYLNQNSGLFLGLMRIGMNNISSNNGEFSLLRHGETRKLSCRFPVLQRSVCYSAL